MPTQLSTFNTNGYEPGPFFKRGLWYLMNALLFKTSFFPFYGVKVWMLRRFGARVGRGLIIKPGVSIKYPWFLQIGNHCWIGEDVWIDNLGLVRMGDNVCISQGALLLSGNHDYTSSRFDLMVKPIVLEEGVWIGACAVVCAGVTCQSHAVLTVGSVATASLEAYGIYQGNPCVKIKMREMKGEGK
jgi:putative colanic acid biosynthesis acetyltransferase WcaF